MSGTAKRSLMCTRDLRPRVCGSLAVVKFGCTTDHCPWVEVVRTMRRLSGMVAAFVVISLVYGSLTAVIPMTGIEALLVLTALVIAARLLSTRSRARCNKSGIPSVTDDGASA